MLSFFLGSSPRSANGSDPGFFEISASSLGVEACDICVCVCVCVCVPFKSGVSVSYIFLTFLKVSLAGIQSQTL